MRFELALLIPRPTLPTGVSGSPWPVIRVHVVPPSRLVHSPLPRPPLVRPHVWISICHVPAKSTRGLDGSITRSLTPVESFTYSTFCHVPPPSVVRKTPRSGCGPYAKP